MITLTVYVSGDHWLNPDEIRDKLSTVPTDENLTLDFCAEGPGLGALGILEMLIFWCNNTGRNPQTIFISNWANAVESIPFVRTSKFLVSHFFWLCEKYITDIPDATHERKFGLFIGRRNTSRMRIMWDMWQRYRDQCLFSLMPSVLDFDPQRELKGISLDGTPQWLPDTNINEFLTWCQEPPIKSIDGHKVQDQYRPEQNTNRDILSHYHRFDIEIVVETYTRGDCFMPTEKTVRPLSAGKPILVYGPKNFLSRLKNMGFKTYDNYWDESYDLLEGFERWQAMLKIVDELSRKDLSGDMDVIRTHNRSHVRNLMIKHRPG